MDKIMHYSDIYSKDMKTNVNQLEMGLVIYGTCIQCNTVESLKRIRFKLDKC